MSPTMTNTSNDILTDSNYYLWEYNTRMALARKELLEHITITPDCAVVAPDSAGWRVADLKAMALIAMRVSASYQSMIRDAKSAIEAWQILQNFFVRRNLHNRVQLRKQLHEFEMRAGDDLLQHLMRFDELCVRLAAVGDAMGDEEKLVILLGSLSDDYDGMVKIIESKGDVSLYDAKEMLQREHERLSRRERTEGAFKVSVQGRQRHGGGRRPNTGHAERSRQSGRQEKQRGAAKVSGAFHGRCYACGQRGHRRDECKNQESAGNGEHFVFSVSEPTHDAKEWLLDSGASSHMTCEKSDFVLYKEVEGEIDVVVANGERLAVRGVGNVEFKFDGGKTALVTGVLYVPGLDRKLLSVPALTAKGADVEFKDDYCTIKVAGVAVVHGRRENKLYKVTVGRRESALAAREDDEALWHARFGHVGRDRVRAIGTAADDAPKLRATEADDDDGDVCEGCAKGKLARSPFARTSGSVVKTSKALELVHTDVIGPMETKTRGGARYALVLVDDWSRYVSVYLLKAKSQVLMSVKSYKAEMESLTGARLRCIRSDNGGEYTSKAFGSFCSVNGITHQTSAPYTPQQNGLAERTNRSLVEMARSMMYHQRMAKDWWGEAVKTAAYTVNRLPNSARKDKTPYEILHGQRPSVGHMRVFGSRGFVHVDDSRRAKWDAKAHRCVFLGYAESSKAYRVWDEEDERVVVTRTVLLDERPLPQYETRATSQTASPPATWTWLDDDDAPTKKPPSVTAPEPTAMDVDEHDNDEEMTADEAHRSDTTIERELTRGQEMSIVERQAPREGGASDENAIVFREIARRRPRDAHYLDGAGGLEHQQFELLPAPPETRLTTWVGERDPREPAPKRPRVTDGYEIALAAEEAPTSYAEALASPDADKWKAAMASELESHLTIGTWALVERPRDAKVIGCKWVYALKRGEDGKVARYKARLVAQGFRQIPGVDCGETYSPVASMNGIRVLLAISCHLGYDVSQLDIETAYLNGVLEEDVYMEPPAGMRADGSRVCKLRRSIYGLKQSGAVWHRTISAALSDMHFEACRSDACLFVRRTQSPVFLALYVDDIIVSSRSSAASNEVKAQLAARFSIKDMGGVRMLLGIRVDYDRVRGILHLGQASFITRLCERFGQCDATAVRSPSVMGQLASETSNSKVMERRGGFRELVGALLYVATCTRPDICAAVGRLSQHLEEPRQEHWLAAIRVLRYLKGTVDVGVVF